MPLARDFAKVENKAKHLNKTCALIDDPSNPTIRERTGSLDSLHASFVAQIFRPVVKVCGFGISIQDAQEVWDFRASFQVARKAKGNQLARVAPQSD
ncbi:MAG TPA: hypothetical protein VGE47_05985, partial [Burkholderiaceae bacterium]